MANENIGTFVQARKKTYEKCLYGDLTCAEKPIDAHSIQNAKVLELIQTNGHVLMPDFRLVDGEPKLEFAKIGRNDASTFTGLCSKHDTELFKSIDTAVKFPVLFGIASTCTLTFLHCDIEI